MNPLVSIITPSYNQGKYIRRTIESVINQDYENLEYIVIDGESTDNTLSILEEYNDKLIYISEKDKGQSHAINKGFKLAKGEIVAWLNSDDIYESNCISKIVKEFMNNQNVGLIYGDGYTFDENDDNIKKFSFIQNFDRWVLINIWDYILQPTTFFRKSYLEKINYLNINLKYCMDWDLWIRLSCISEVYYLKEPLAYARIYEETKTSSGGKERLKEIKSLMQYYSGKKNPTGYLFYYTEWLYNNNTKKLGRKLIGSINNLICYSFKFVIKIRKICIGDNSR